MEKIKAHLPAFSQFSRLEKSLLCIISALLVAVIAITCISINIRVNMQKDYNAVRTRMSESLYSNLNMLAQTFDMTSVPNADIKNSVLPQMKNYFVASTTVNELMVNAYGARYQLLTDSDISALRTAFNSYDAAFRSDAPTDLAQADMQTCITRVRDLLSSRFVNGNLKTTR